MPSSVTLQSLAAHVHDILQQEDSPATREQVALVLGEALRDRAFVDSLFDGSSPERKVVHEDPQLGFCILAHRYTGAKSGPPHDHGPSWAIYGQADGETVMSDWLVVDTAAPGKAGRVRKVREYTLTPGLAHVYNEGAVHAPSRTGPTRLIRIEGTNLERVTRGRYEPVEDQHR
jgi:predicted metal-dependent enzyme (double-stranded beta helix superfamily)